MTTDLILDCCPGRRGDARDLRGMVSAQNKVELCMTPVRGCEGNGGSD